MKINIFYKEGKKAGRLFFDIKKADVIYPAWRQVWKYKAFIRKPEYQETFLCYRSL